MLSMLMYERGHLTECSRTTCTCMMIMFPGHEAILQSRPLPYMRSRESARAS